jgi:hypothetical protein
MRFEICWSPRHASCISRTAFRVLYPAVHSAEAPATTLQEALDWTWRFANVVHQGDPWVKTGLRLAMVGDVFLVNGEAHAVMMMGFERFEFQREGDLLISQVPVFPQP